MNREMHSTMAPTPCRFVGDIVSFVVLFDANGSDLNFWTRRKNTEDYVEGVLTVGVEAVRRSLFDLVQNLRKICVERKDRQTSEQKIRKKSE